MQGKTRSHKPTLTLRLDKVIRRRKLAKINEVLEEIDIKLESCLNVKSSVSPLLGILDC